MLRVEWIYQHFLSRLVQDDFDALGTVAQPRGEEKAAESGGFEVRGSDPAITAVRKTAVEAIRPLF